MPPQNQSDIAKARAEAEADLARIRGEAAADLAAVRGGPIEAVSSHEPAKRSPAADFGIGAAKGVGKTVLDLNKLLSYAAPRGFMRPSPEMDNALRNAGIDPDTLQKKAETNLQPTNSAQYWGSWAPDAAMIAMPALRGARTGVHAIRNRAAQMWQNAASRDPLESTRLAQEVLDSGFYKLTGQNARNFAGAFPKSTEARTALYEGVKLAREQPQTIGKWATGMISPGVKANVAGKINAAAPALAGAKAAINPAVADILARFLAGEK